MAHFDNPTNIGVTSHFVFSIYIHQYQDEIQFILHSINQYHLIMFFQLKFYQQQIKRILPKIYLENSSRSLGKYLFGRVYCMAGSFRHESKQNDSSIYNNFVDIHTPTTLCSILSDVKMSIKIVKPCVCVYASSLNSFNFIKIWIHLRIWLASNNSIFHLSNHLNQIKFHSCG